MHASGSGHFPLVLKDGKIQRTFKEKGGVDDFHVIGDESGEKLANYSSFLLRDYAENALTTEPRDFHPAPVKAAVWKPLGWGRHNEKHTM